VSRKLFFLLCVVSGIVLFIAQDFPKHSEASKRSPQGEFTLVRLIYPGGDSLNNWATDHPKADEQLVLGLRRVTGLDYVNPEPKAIHISDPELFEYPFAYAVEVSQMQLSDSEARTLREYLLRGGFLAVDDFHGDQEWGRFAAEMKEVFPEYEPVDLPLSHPIFNCFYDIDNLIQIPGLQYLYTGSVSEKGGTAPHYRGIIGPGGRIMVMITHNSDLGDAWEWADMPSYSSVYATRAYQLATNYVIYSMTH